MPGREPRTEMIEIAGYRVPLYLVESYARMTAKHGAYEEHQAIFWYLYRHYPLVKKYMIFHSVTARLGHMHLEMAQKILDDEFENLAEFKPVAKFAVELDKEVEKIWEKEHIGWRRNR